MTNFILDEVSSYVLVTSWRPQHCPFTPLPQSCIATPVTPLLQGHGSDNDLGSHLLTGKELFLHTLKMLLLPCRF